MVFVVLIGHSTFDERNIYPTREFLDIDDWAVDDIDQGGQIEEPLVQIEERHMAAGTTAEPGGSDFQTSHSLFSLADMMNWSRDRSFSISATVEPCRKMAPVGHPCTHLPQEVQVGESPQG